MGGRKEEEAFGRQEEDIRLGPLMYSSPGGYPRNPSSGQRLRDGWIPDQGAQPRKYDDERANRLTFSFTSEQRMESLLTVVPDITA